MSAIKTNNLKYVYNKGLADETTAVNGISVEIEEGDFVGIIGHTGSGKSTFIQMLNGLLTPAEGEVIVGGENIFENKKTLRAARFKVGLVFQYPEYQLFEETVYKDVAFGPRNMRLSDEDIDRRVRESIRSVGLTEDILESSPFELSGGQKRRVAIAGVLAMEPEILILDEPASGLDPQGRLEILSLINDYHEVKGNTVMLVSHSMEDIAKYTKRVLVINKGEVFDFDTVENVFSHADALERMGLTVPQVTKVFLELRRRGFELPKSVYTTEYAAKRLLARMGGER